MVMKPALSNVNFYQNAHTWTGLPAGVYTCYVRDTDPFSGLSAVRTTQQITIIELVCDTVINDIIETAGDNQTASVVIDATSSIALEYSLDGVNYQPSNVFSNLWNGTTGTAHARQINLACGADGITAPFVIPCPYQIDSISGNTAGYGFANITI